MTALEAYELATHGGTSDFHRLIGACESLGPCCLIGDLAVNCYVGPVYTLDAVGIRAKVACLEDVTRCGSL